MSFGGQTPDGCTNGSPIPITVKHGADRKGDKSDEPGTESEGSPVSQSTSRSSRAAITEEAVGEGIDDGAAERTMGTLAESQCLHRGKPSRAETRDMSDQALLERIQKSSSRIVAMSEANDPHIDDLPTAPRPRPPALRPMTADTRGRGLKVTMQGLVRRRSAVSVAVSHLRKTSSDALGDDSPVSATTEDGLPKWRKPRTSQDVLSKNLESEFEQIKAEISSLNGSHHALRDNVQDNVEQLRAAALEAQTQLTEELERTREVTAASMERIDVVIADVRAEFADSIAKSHDYAADVATRTSAAVEHTAERILDEVNALCRPLRAVLPQTDAGTSGALIGAVHAGEAAGARAITQAQFFVMSSRLDLVEHRVLSAQGRGRSESPAPEEPQRPDERRPHKRTPRPLWDSSRPRPVSAQDGAPLNLPDRPSNTRDGVRAGSSASRAATPSGRSTPIAAPQLRLPTHELRAARVTSSDVVVDDPLVGMPSPTPVLVPDTEHHILEPFVDETDNCGSIPRALPRVSTLHGHTQHSAATPRSVNSSDTPRSDSRAGGVLDKTGSAKVQRPLRPSRGCTARQNSWNRPPHPKMPMLSSHTLAGAVLAAPGSN